MVTKDQLSVGMSVMARHKFDENKWFPATVTDLREVGLDPLVEMDILYPDLVKKRIVVRGMRHVNDIRLIVGGL
ncbi:hypothetical protein LCGC14_1388090 [marine sediment metagenome]|uniref:Uncharacterized protein n=1 Tax=marine sediment metagenome TaxID=412755 RepID=A0A0F9MGA7_9ZZZZ